MRAKLPDVESFVVRNGVKIHYEVFGEGDHTILFLPAFPIVHSRKWKGQIPYFSRRYQCVTFDPRGNGRSDRPVPPEAYRIDEIIDDAIAILDELGVQQVILVGLSMGGLLGAVLAAYRPDRVKAAVLIGGTYPVQPDYGFINPEHFNAHFETHDGWRKYNRHFWHTNYPDFAEFFIGRIHSDPHSTKQIEDALSWALETSGDTLTATVLGRMQQGESRYPVGTEMFKRIRCKLLLIHGEADQVQPAGKSKVIAELTGARLELLPGVGHSPPGRYPALVNMMIRDFLDQTLDESQALKAAPARRRDRRVLYLSSPIGLGHARRDLAIAQELRRLRPDVKIDWLAQDPVTRFLSANAESIHPRSALLISESRHIEEESGEHDLHAFQALRRMDEILVANFMVFQELLEAERYDLVVADEAWDVDHFWHEHPSLKRSALAWLTDFVGFIPMPQGGDREALLTADYNAEMIEHIENAPALRDCALFVGNSRDVVPGRFGAGLPDMPDWVARHFEFSGYVTGFDPRSFGSKEMLRASLGYRPDEQVCIVTVGGSGVGAALLRRIIAAYPTAKRRVPGLRMIVVTGPRIQPETLNAPPEVELRAFVPDLNRHLTACDIALVQGGLTTCMELTAAKVRFIYFPLRNHFEQNFHVHHRLQQYGAGRRMNYENADPEGLAEALVQELARPVSWRDVEIDGARRVAERLVDFFP